MYLIRFDHFVVRFWSIVIGYILPSNKIKVLFIIPTLEIGGGAEKNAFNLGNKFKARYDIRYLNFYNKTRVYDTGQFVYNLNERSNKNLISKFLYDF